MSERASKTFLDRYEQACDRAIATCDGNMRSTIMALIIANEYLEAEVEKLRATSNSFASASSPRTKKGASSRKARHILRQRR